MTETTGVSLGMVNLDCSDPRAEASFWSALLDWEVVMAEDQYALLKSPESMLLAFGKVPDYQPPTWPNEHGSKQFHLDLACADMAATEAKAVELGASVVDPQPGDTWRVLIDPDGHPFCLTDAKNWG